MKLKKLATLAITLSIFTALSVPATADATELDKQEETIAIGGVTSVNILGNDEGSVTWSVKDPSMLDIIEQDAGHVAVRGKKIGTTDIIAKTDWWSYDCQVCVIKPKNRVVYKGNGITAKVTGLTVDSYGDTQIMFNIKNSSGKKITAYAEDVSINGYMVNEGSIGEVSPKNQINDNLEIYKKYMNKNKITDIKTVQFRLQFFDSGFDKIDESERVKVKF